ncbi:hypothetical protein BC833DRAFT_533537, partial [Globomyces pollinis-pini]
MVRAQLKQANMSVIYWPEVMLYCTYVHNRLPNYKHQTPHNAWTGKEVDISHFKVFGCSAWSKLPQSNVRKWTMKAKKYCFIGYGDNTKG